MAKDLKGKADKGETDLRLDAMQRDIEQLGVRCSETTARVAGLHLKANKGEVQALQDEVARLNEFGQAGETGLLVQKLHRGRDTEPGFKRSPSPSRRVVPSPAFGLTASPGDLKASGVAMS